MQVSAVCGVSIPLTESMSGFPCAFLRGTKLSVITFGFRSEATALSFFLARQAKRTMSTIVIFRSYPVEKKMFLYVLCKAVRTNPKNVCYVIFVKVFAINKPSDKRCILRF